MKFVSAKFFSKLIKNIKNPPLIKKMPDCVYDTLNPKMADSMAKNVAEKVRPDIVLSQSNKTRIAELLGLSAIGSTTAYAKTKESSQKLGGYSSTTA